ncbi:regulator of chromosome condensation 1/beta-lactamase-inhibitor protein II, partial [Baffinella frigidus]
MLISDPCVVIDRYNDLSCAVFTNVSQVKCWGSCYYGCGYGNNNNIGDNSGEMGTNLPFIDLGDFPVASVSVGTYYVCALSKSGRVKCWGANYIGQLGIGGTADRGEYPEQMGSNLAEVNLGTGASVVKLSVGASHACVILDNNSVKCWVYGRSGQLGYGSTANVGKFLSDMGDNLPVVDVGVGVVLNIWALGMSTCVQMSSGDVKCWGGNGFGALGTDRAGKVGTGEGQMGSMDGITPVDVGGNGTVLQVSVEFQHACTLRQSREVVCWGKSSQGTFGYGDSLTVGSSSDQMGDNLHVVDLGNTSATPVVALANGYKNTCVVLSNGDVKCWGSNLWGMLGMGDSIHRGGGLNQMGSYLPPVDL